MMKSLDEEENSFLSDKKIGEVEPNNTQYRRRGAYIKENIAEVESEQFDEEDEEDEEENDVVSKVIIIIAIITIAVSCGLLGIIFLKNNKKASTNTSQNTNTSVNTSSGTNTNANTSTTSNSTSNNKENSNSNTSTNNSTISLSDTYNAYPITIESKVEKQAGNFFNNTEKIKGDKVYVEYKQIFGLKDKTLEDKINAKLKALSVDLYDKNYLSDKETLFFNVHTKLSVNFNIISYVIIVTHEDIDGKHIDEKAISYNISIEDMQEIKLEDIFVNSTDIKKIFGNYVKGKEYTYYITPEKLVIYDGIKEQEILLKNHYNELAIYTKYKNDSLYNTQPVKKNVFTTLDSTVEEKCTQDNYIKN